MPLSGEARALELLPRFVKSRNSGRHPSSRRRGACGGIAVTITVCRCLSGCGGFVLSPCVQVWARGWLVLGMVLSARRAATSSSWLSFCASDRVCGASACAWFSAYAETYGFVGRRSTPLVLARKTFTRL